MYKEHDQRIRVKEQPWSYYYEKRQGFTWFRQTNYLGYCNKIFRNIQLLWGGSLFYYWNLAVVIDLDYDKYYEKGENYFLSDSFLCALRFELDPQTLPRQLTQPRRPHGTRKLLLSAAPFPTWHGSQVPVAWDPNINITYRGQPCRLPPSAQYHPCYSGLQVQGTANTPAARVLILHGFWENVNRWGRSDTKSVLFSILF